MYIHNQNKKVLIAFWDVQVKCYAVTSSQDKSIRAPSTGKNMIQSYEIERNETGRNWKIKQGNSVIKEDKNVIHTHGERSWNISIW